MPAFGTRILWQRAADYVATYKPRLIGVAGSTGKTFTRQAIAVALGDSVHVRTPDHNDNSLRGIALSVLGIPSPRTPLTWMSLLSRSFVKELKVEEPTTIVVEYGTAKPGELDWAASKVPLAVLVVTNVEAKHLTLFGSKEMIAHEYASLVVTLLPEVTLVLNADDSLVLSLAEKTKARVVTYGSADGANVRLIRTQRLPHHGFACEVSVRGRTYELHLPQLITRRQISSLLAALAVATLAGTGDMQSVISKLQKLSAPPGRMRLLKGLNNALLVDDTYNATPEDMLGGLETLRSLPARRRIAILGDISDLGAEENRWHQKIGKFAGDVAHIVVLVGQAMRHAGTEALQKGVDVHHFDTSEDVGKWIAGYLQDGDVVLIKGSRSMHMEEVTRR
ncbi:MAG: Mur ligase family protein, partial [Candidatus Andersenbacteria bacterium]